MLEDAGAWHTAELQFCFDNTKRCEQGTGNTPEAQALAKKMASAWANFAKDRESQPAGIDLDSLLTRIATRPWSGTTNVAWSMILRARCGRFC